MDAVDVTLLFSAVAPQLLREIKERFRRIPGSPYAEDRGGDESVDPAAQRSEKDDVDADGSVPPRLRWESSPLPRVSGELDVSGLAPLPSNLDSDLSYALPCLIQASNSSLSNMTLCAQSILFLWTC